MRWLWKFFLGHGPLYLKYSFFIFLPASQFIFNKNSYESGPAFKKWVRHINVLNKNWLVLILWAHLPNHKFVNEVIKSRFSYILFPIIHTNKHALAPEYSMNDFSTMLSNVIENEVDHR